MRFMMRSITMALIISIVFLSSIEYASASFAVGTACDPNKCYSNNFGSLQLKPGTPKEVYVVVQNTGNEDLLLKAEITPGMEYATFVDGNQHIVPSGDTNYKVKIRVNVHENYNGGDFSIGVKFTGLVSGGEQTVRFSPVIGISFPVQINMNAPEEVFPEDVDEPDKDTKNGDAQEKKDEGILGWFILLLILILFLAGIVIYFVMVNRRKKLAFPDDASF